MGSELPGIADYDEKDFIEVFGDVINYNGNLQLNIRQIRKAEEGEYNPADYMPTTDKSVDGMYEELTAYIRQISNKYLRQVLEFYYIKDEAFIKNSRHIPQRRQYITDFPEDCLSIHSV